MSVCELTVGMQSGPARLLGELGCRLWHHSSGHALEASKCLLGGIKMSYINHFMRKHFA